MKQGSDPSTYGTKRSKKQKHRDKKTETPSLVGSAAWGYEGYEPERD